MFKCNFEANKLSGRRNRITGFYQIKPALIRQYFASLNNTVNFESGARHEGEEVETAAPSKGRLWSLPPLNLT